MSKLQIVLNDPNHGVSNKPEGDQFDNNYLYYLYCKGESEGGKHNHLKYDDARKYLHEHIPQIVHNAKRRDIIIPFQLHDDCNIEMFIIVDDLYRQIFEDEREYTITDRKGNESTGTRFEKYYTPQQVYGYIKLVVKNRIFTYLEQMRKRKDEDILYNVSDYSYDSCLVGDMEEIKTNIACNSLVHIVLGKLFGVSPIEKEVFVAHHLQGKTLEEISRNLNAKGIAYSTYKVKKISKKVLGEIKEHMSQQDLGVEDFI